jgi:hypothetical protein
LTEEATDVLRDRYRQILDKTETEEPLNGHQFNAFVQAGADSPIKTENTINSNENSEMAYDSYDSKSTTPTTQPTFTSNFLGVRH